MGQVDAYLNFNFKAKLHLVVDRTGVYTMNPSNKRLAIFFVLAVSLGVAYWMYLQPQISFSADVLDNVPHSAPGKGATVEQRIKTEVTGRLLAEHPLGSSESALIEHLKREKCSPKLQWEQGNFARCNRRIGLFQTEITTVIWKSNENGSLLTLEGTVFREFLFAP